MRAPIIGFAISNFCFASFIVLGPVIFKEHLGGAGELGVVSTCGALGAILGALSSTTLHPQRPLTFGFTVSVLLGAPIAALAGPLSVSAIAAAWFLGMGSIALSNITGDEPAAADPDRRVLARAVLRHPRVVRVHAARFVAFR